MRYLLDVSSLIALGVEQHFFHRRASEWAFAQEDAIFLTCSITELGFVRIVAQVPEYVADVQNAKTLLSILKSGKLLNFQFVADHHDAALLPGWIEYPRQTTDGHLLELAKAHGAVLATFDTKIPGAFLIP
jgi:predicted nucleic acid-binding protein